MAKGFDFRKTLRQLAHAAQDENQRRLLERRTVEGGPVLPDKARQLPSLSNRKRRIRIGGVRRSLSDFVGTPGVRSGDMLKDATRRANAKIGRRSFKIVPSPEIRARWFAFMMGVKDRQPKRPISGLDDKQLAHGAAVIAKDARDQLVRNLNERLGITEGFQFGDERDISGDES